MSIPPHTFAADLEPDYPTGDGKPLAETPIHRDNLLDGVKTLESFFADDPMVYVSGNMLVYYDIAPFRLFRYAFRPVNLLQSFMRRRTESSCEGMDSDAQTHVS